MPSLFESIHHGHPERLAQLVLLHALRTQRSLRELLGLQPGAEAELRLEQYDDSGQGWRADVVAPDFRCELKLRAKFTPAQISAITQGRVDVIVTPTDRVAPIKHELSKIDVRGRARVVSWATLAASVYDDQATAALLLQADQMGSWLLGEVTPTQLNGEMDCFITLGRGRTWPKMYQFLSTVDSQLREELASYRATGGWSCSSRQKYYGYAFFLGGESTSPVWWVGFQHTNAGVELVLYKNERCITSITPFTVDAVVFKIRESAPPDE